MSTKLEYLEWTAYKNGIQIYDVHISDTKKAACYQSGISKTIILDKQTIRSNAEESVLLAEEVGHYMTGGLYKINPLQHEYAAGVEQRKYERRAKTWAYEECLPPKEIQKAISQVTCNNFFEIAQECDITEGFLREAIEYYQSNGIRF